jgi:hypothetical protein
VKAPIRRFSSLAVAAGLVLLWPVQALAVNYFARFMVGSYISNEQFTNDADGSRLNSFATISSRMYLRASQLTSGNLELVGDVRDKHDFFDKLDAERLQLTASNTLQLRQLALRANNETGSLYADIGRFPIPEAGDVNTDGAEVGYRWTPSWRTSIFGGLNPKRQGQTYLQYNPDSNVLGAYTLFQPRNQGWNTSTYVSNAIVTEQVSGHQDRLYFYNNFIYQWNSPNQIAGVLYLDFVPRTYVQTALLTFHLQETQKVSTTASVIATDVIEYTRRRGILETLPASPYREGSASLRQIVSSGLQLDYSTSYGMRQADGLHKTEFALGPIFPTIINPHFQAKGSFGYRWNFTAQEEFLKLGISYFSKDWEVGLDQEIGYRLEASGLVYHPDVTEVSVARYLSRALYATVSVERGSMETVSVLSGFFKLGLRVGSRDVAPLRDGAPATGGKL